MKQKAAAYKKPYFIDELANEGLTTIDIAQCLGMPHPKVAKLFHETNKSTWGRKGWDYAIAMAGCAFLSIEAARVFLRSLLTEAAAEYAKFLAPFETSAKPKAIPKDRPVSKGVPMTKLSRGAIDEARRERSKKLIA